MVDRNDSRNICPYIEDFGIKKNSNTSGRRLCRVVIRNYSSWNYPAYNLDISQTTTPDCR